jgi:hypothetical protein
MGVPMPDMEPVENASAEALLSSLKTIEPGERRKHASVFNYWLTIRGNRQFPPIRDLDPLEISDAGPWSVLLEMIGGGEDAVVRHFGQEIRGGLEVEKIGDAPNPSLLSCIHAKLPIVAACREAFAFEDAFETQEGKRRCWVTLLPFSANGTWIDFVYGYVSLDGADAAAKEAPQTVEEQQEAIEEPIEEFAEPVPEETVAEEAIEDAPEPFKVELKPYDEEAAEAGDAPAAALEIVPEVEPEAEPVGEYEPEPEPEPEAIAEYEPEAEPEMVAEFEAEPEPELDSDSRPSFTSKFMESVTDFYGKVVQTGPELPTEAFVAEEIVEQTEPAREMEGALHSKLTDVRALAEEARQAQIRSNNALYQGLSAAYDFALDAEGAPEEYLKLVEGQGLKIQLRSPMKPVVRLVFDGTCDEPTIAQLEAVLAWALKQDLPRGSLVERIEAEGGIGQILSGRAA